MSVGQSFVVIGETLVGLACLIFLRLVKYMTNGMTSRMVRTLVLHNECKVGRQFVGSCHR